MRGSQWSFCRQSLDKNGPKSQVAGIFRSLTPSGSGPVQALEMCRARGFLASQNQLFPSLTLAPSAFAIASKSPSPPLPHSVLSWLKFSWVKGAFPRRLGNGLSIFLLVNGYFETTMLSLSDTMLSSFDVYTIWLYYPLPSLIASMCGLPGHSQIFIENSDTWATATRVLSRRTPSTFLVDLRLKPLWPADSDTWLPPFQRATSPARILLSWRMAPIPRASIIAIYLTIRPTTPSPSSSVFCLYNFIPLV